MHTTSNAGSFSRLNCKCTPGYSCTYYKKIQAIVTLNVTITDFNNDVGGVRTAFLAAMAAAANVTSDHVVINGVTVSSAASQQGRRLLSIVHVKHELTVAEEFAALPQVKSLSDTMSGPVNMDTVRVISDHDSSAKDKHGDAQDESDEDNHAARRLLSVFGRGENPMIASKVWGRKEKAIGSIGSKQQRPSSVGALGSEHEGIHVYATVSGSGLLHQLGKHLAEKHSGALLISHRWEQANRVLATKI
jgi:hypothetical protein